MLHLFSMASPYLQGKYRYDMFRCRQCEFVQAEGPDDQEILKEVYGGAFHETTQQRADVDADELFTPRGLRFPVIRNAVDRVDWLKALGLRGTLLDIGAGKGYFVKASQSSFSAEGIDISDTAVDFARSIGADVRHEDFMSGETFPTDYDVVTMWDVLSGFRDPDVVFARLQGIVRAGGTLIFTVPMATSLMARLGGRFWPMYIPPVNLSYFSDKSIRILLSRYGYEIVKVEYRSKRVAIGFLVFKLLRSFGLRLSGDYPENGFLQLPVPVNTGDILTVVARRHTVGEP